LRKGVIQTLKFFAFLVVGLILLWLAFRKTDYEKLYADLREANYFWILLSIVFSILAYLSRARRWMILINPLGYKPAFSSTYHAVMIGYLANIALPRLGEVSRCYALGRKEKIPVDLLFGTVIIERTIDFFSLVIIMLVVLFTSSTEMIDLMNESIFNPLQQKFLEIFGVTWIIWAVLMFLMIAALVLMIKYKKKLRKIRFFNKMFDIAKGLLNGLKSITKLERRLEFILLTIFIWLNYALMTWVVVFSIENTSHITFGESFFILVIGGLAMTAPVQGGFGVFHYVVSRALIIIGGVSMEDGLAYALLTHESQLIFIAIAGAVSFFLIFRKDKKAAIEALEPADLPKIPD
jgi:glycosyltransferase 2 family protein